MPHFDFTQLSAAQIYKFMTGSLIPRPIAWITTQNSAGVVNAAPFSFFNGAGGPFVTLSIGRNEGALKDTAHNLIVTKEAVIHLTDMDNAENMNQTSATLAPEASEIQAFNLKTLPSHGVTVPGLENARIRFEVKLHQHQELISKGLTYDFFLLEVLHLHIAEDIFDSEKQYILPQALKPVARLSGNNYASLGEFFEMKRPT